MTEETEHARGFNAGIQAALELLARHEQDRQLLSRRGLKQRKADGKKTGGDVPYGYQLAADGETLRANLDEQRVIVKVRKLRPNHSLRAIARKLKEARIFPRSYDPQDPTSISEFQAVQIRRMLGKPDDKESPT
jgi:DNA invertase Pin-like site-specific DNA recombinase